MGDNVLSCGGDKRALCKWTLTVYNDGGEEQLEVVSFGSKSNKLEN